MKLFKIVVWACLIACGLCQTETGENPGLSETSTLINWSDGSTNYDEISTNTDIDTDNDTIIKFSTSPSEEISSNETTVFGDDITSSDTVTSGDEQNTTEIMESMCSSNPCKNGGTCNDEPSIPAYSCACPERYVGLRCQTEDLCVTSEDGHLCKNGSCKVSMDGLTQFCTCFIGYFWDNATSECKEKTSVCDSNPCQNGGMCSLLPDNKYNCTCEVGFSGTVCEITDQCVEDVDCGSGTCVLSKDKKTRSCNCNNGFYLEEQLHTCKVITTPCDSNPCTNGGMCNTFGNMFNCTCEIGFSGNLCEITDWCVADNDCGHGVCTLSEDKKTRSCKCNDGFYLEKTNHTCKEISSICDTKPCLNYGICTVISANDFNCTCSEGYTGKKCETRDMCKMDGGNAFCRDGTCENNNELGIYYCTCSDQEYFQYTERKCAEVDLCPLVQCKSNEKCWLGKCICKDNYEWKNATQKCEPNFCASNPCPIPEMVCEEGTDGTNYKCSCQKGYTFNGTHCNEALCIFPHLNPCTQFCTVADDKYECSCDENFQLKEDNHTCEHIGNETCSNKTCHMGTCVLKSEEEICICPPGYIEVDGNCTDICSAAKFAPGICPTNECEIPTDGGFRCKCDGKFALSADKVTCVVRNMCQENEIGWKQCKNKNAECVQNWDIEQGFQCRCMKGQVVTEDGTCKDVCSVENNQRNCSMKGATCDVDKSGNMKCRCPPYFQANEKDGRCNKPAEASYLITLPLDPNTYMLGNQKQRSLDTSINYKKISRDVKITIEEMFIGFTRANVLYCNTTSGYILCKIEIQFVAEHEKQLKRLETEDICLTSEDSKKCLLPPALVLVKERISRDVVIVPTDPCDEFIKEEICGSETSCTSSLSSRSFNCSCKPGFLVRKRSYPFSNDKSFVESCKDIDECVENDPCPANSECLNTIGSFSCRCKTGFRSDMDSAEKCVEICYPNPCTHGACSRRNDHEFDCKCDAGYRGALCDLQDENFKRARINTVIVGVVLGGILLITFILFAVCVSRLRKRKYLENPGHMFYNTTEMKERGRINNAFQRE